VLKFRRKFRRLKVKDFVVLRLYEGPDRIWVSDLNVLQFSQFHSKRKYESGLNVTVFCVSFLMVYRIFVTSCLYDEFIINVSGYRFISQN